MSTTEAEEGTRGPDEQGLRVIAIGGSANGLRGLAEILRAFPAGLPAAVLIAQHRRRGKTSQLARLLSRHCHLPVKEATDEVLRPGVVYLAPPDHHLIVDDQHLSLSEAPPVNFCRPSVDVTFQSVASVYGSRAIGVILSGSGRDGAKGLRAIKDLGGTTIVQDPRDARVTSMPLQAVAADHVDLMLPVSEIGPALVRLVTQPRNGDTDADEPAPQEVAQ